MHSGQLRHRIHIQRDSATRNPDGGLSSTWTSIAARWAAIEPSNAREQLVAEQQQAQATHRITLRYFAGLLPTDRILFGTRVFNILAIINTNERNRELQLLCIEVIA